MWRLRPAGQPARQNRPTDQTASRPIGQIADQPARPNRSEGNRPVIANRSARHRLGNRKQLLSHFSSVFSCLGVMTAGFVVTEGLGVT